MTRSCDTCEWWRTETIDGLGVQRMAGPLQVCTESAVHVPTTGKHFCGRWRIAERLTDEARR